MLRANDRHDVPNRQESRLCTCLGQSFLQGRAQSNLHHDGRVSPCLYRAHHLLHDDGDDPEKREVMQRCGQPLTTHRHLCPHLRHWGHQMQPVPLDESSRIPPHRRHRGRLIGLHRQTHS